MRQALHPQQRQVHTQTQDAMAHPAIRMRELRLPEPKEFRGTRDKTSIREWIRDIEEIFTMGMMPMDHHTTIVYAAHYLRDDAKTWYKMHEASITSWNAFKHLMIERYKDPREVDKARTRLLTTKQVGSVDSYTTTFDRATLELTEVAGQAPRDEELLFYYRERLKSPIKTFLAARGAITNLRELQEVAMEIDAAMNSNRVNTNTSGGTSLNHHNIKLVILDIVIIINSKNLGDRNRINLEDSSKTDSLHQVVILQTINTIKVVPSTITKVDSQILVVAVTIITEVILLWILVIP